MAISYGDKKYVKGKGYTDAKTGKIVQKTSSSKSQMTSDNRKTNTLVKQGKLPKSQEEIYPQSTSSSSGYDKGQNYSKLIEDTMRGGNYDQNYVDYLAKRRENKIKAEGITGVKSTADLVSQYSKAKPKKATFPTFEKFSSPALKVFEQRVKDKYRPEWQRYTYNPAVTQYGNQTAATGSFMLGSAPNTYRDYTDQLTRSFEEQQQTARDALLAQIRDDYNRRLYENTSSPININDYFGY